MLLIVQVVFSILVLFHDARVIASPIKEKEVCTLFDDASLKLAIEATTPEARLKLITEDVLPTLSLNSSIVTPATTIPPLSNESTDTISKGDALRRIYTAIARQLNQRDTEVGFKRFMEVANEVSIARVEACNGSSRFSENVSQLMQDFANTFELDDISTQHAVRFLFGQLLCRNSAEQSRVRRDTGLLVDSRKCKCPPGGLHGTDWSKFEVCDFFACLEDGRILKEIFFTRDFKIDIQCLAFVVDTTGSMVDEIDTAKRIILDFLRSEQEIGVEGCYILVPFNDVGVPEESVGPIAFAYSSEAQDLYEFYESVQDLSAYDGGDGPEYALYGMLEGLKAKHGPFPLMVEGSQMVVLTDAPTKQPELEALVKTAAIKQEVCVHFFVSERNGINPLSDGIYQHIADETHGTLLSSFNHWEIANFVAGYQMDGCSFLENFHDKRSSPSSCSSFSVSRLAANLRLSINSHTGSLLTITRPNGTKISIATGKNDLAFFDETNPVYGSWSVCSSSSEAIKVNDISTYQIDTTVLYGSRNISSMVPPACTSENVVVISSDHNLIQSALLNIVDRSGIIVKHINLTKDCKGYKAFFSDAVTFPSGSYFYRLVGVDIDGVAFRYDVKERITYRQPDIGAFSFVPLGGLAVEVDVDESVTLEYNFTNRWKYNTNFSFTGCAPDGFSSSIEPEHALVTAGGAVKVQLLVRVVSPSIRPGTSHTVMNVTATTCSGHQIHAPSRTVTIQQPATTESPTVPTADECGGCLNGGSCVVYYRRGRQISRCSCPPDYGGGHCQVQY